MIIGIDVYHSPGEHNSWAGFVASLDTECTKWYSQTVDQKDQRREMIDSLRVLLAKALNHYLEV